MKSNPLAYLNGKDESQRNHSFLPSRQLSHAQRLSSATETHANAHSVKLFALRVLFSDDQLCRPVRNDLLERVLEVHAHLLERPHNGLVLSLVQRLRIDPSRNTHVDQLMDALHSLLQLLVPLLELAALALTKGLHPYSLAEQQVLRHRLPIHLVELQQVLVRLAQQGLQPRRRILAIPFCARWNAAEDAHVAPLLLQQPHRVVALLQQLLHPVSQRPDLALERLLLALCALHLLLLTVALLNESDTALLQRRQVLLHARQFLASSLQLRFLRLHRGRRVFREDGSGANLRIRLDVGLLQVQLRDTEE